MKRSHGPIANNKLNELTPEEIEEGKTNPYPDDIRRPRDRAECWDFKNDRPIGPRPCPFVSCRFNNFLWVTKRGTIILSHPGREPGDVPKDHSCAWDVSERSDRDLPDEKELGEIIGMTSAGVHHVIEHAQDHARKIRRRLTVVNE